MTATHPAAPPTLSAAVTRLAALVREVCDMPNMKHAATYAAAIAELACLHDEAAKFPRGTPENRQAYAEATAVWNAARKFALRHGLPTPNDALRSMGYTV